MTLPMFSGIWRSLPWINAVALNASVFLQGHPSDLDERRLKGTKVHSLTTETLISKEDQKEEHFSTACNKTVD